MTQPQLTPLAQKLPSTVPFVGPETQERARGSVFSARLGANESSFGPSPLVIAAMQAAASDTWMYGDPENYDLRSALSRVYGTPMENIVVGEGIDGLLGYLVRLFISDGDAVVTSAGAYPTFNYHVAGFGGVVHAVPYRDDHEDPAALIAKAIEVGAKLIYFANPDNPMGTHHSAETVLEMIAKVPSDCLLILDEAYVELAPEGTAPTFDPNTPNVIRMRTFSKAYGMAGARVGHAIGPVDLITAFGKIRNHFGMSRIGQAGALAAIADTAYLEDIRGKVAAARDRISQIAADNGLSIIPSATNFVAVDCGQDGDFARRVLAELIARDLFVRMPFVAPQDRCIRVSCGTPSQMDQLAAALPEALIAARSS